MISALRTAYANLSVLILALILSGCMTTTDLGGTTSASEWSKISNATSALLYCDGAKPIRWSAKDTDETIKQAKEQNAIGVQLCGWGKR